MINAAKEKWDTVLILIVILGTLLGIINPRFDALETSLNARFDSLETRFESLETRVGALETQIGALDARVDSLDARVGAVEAQIGALDARVNALDAKVESGFHSLETKIDNKFDNLASMMVIAHIDGEATEEELLAIWQQVGSEQDLPAD